MMQKYYMEVLYALTLLILLMLTYAQGRYNSKNSKFIKRKVLSFSGALSKESSEEVLRGIYLTIIVVALISFLKLTDTLYIMRFFPRSVGLSLIGIIISIIALIQIMFLLLMFVYGLILKKNPVEAINSIDWIAVQTNRFIYTGYIRPLLVAAFESFIFYNVIFNILSENLQLNTLISVVLTVIIYSLCKGIMRKKLDKSIPLMILGFSLSLCGILLVIACDSLLVGTIFMYISIIFIAFKNIKVQL